MDNNELRLAIAKAKGWKDVRYDKIRNEWVGTPINQNPKISFIINASVPNWPEDMSAAWDLVHAIVSEPTAMMDLQYDGTWTMKFYSDTGFVAKRDGTAPRAICLAYLAWKEGAK